VVTTRPILGLGTCQGFRHAERPHVSKPKGGQDFKKDCRINEKRLAKTMSKGPGQGGAGVHVFEGPCPASTSVADGHEAGYREEVGMSALQRMSKHAGTVGEGKELTSCSRSREEMKKKLLEVSSE